MARSSALVLRCAARFDTMLDGHEVGHEFGNQDK